MVKPIVDVHCYVVGNEKMMSEELREIFGKLLPCLWVKMH
jgi:hypothetical protein